MRTGEGRPEGDKRLSGGLGDFYHPIIARFLPLSLCVGKKLMIFCQHQEDSVIGGDGLPLERLVDVHPKIMFSSSEAHYYNARRQEQVGKKIEALNAILVIHGIY